MTLVCVPIVVRDLDSALADAVAARDAGADLVEFRIDDVFHGEGDQEGERTVLKVVAGSPLPCIVTCRPAWEGGLYDGDEAARISLFERLGTAFGEGEHPPRYLDVELEALERSPNVRQKVRLAVDHPEQVRDMRTSLILSVHDFESRPADLSRRIIRLRRESAAKVHKIAFRARTIRDNLELFDILADRDRPTIALGMGEFGLLSRVLAPKFGGFLTFASLRPETVTAPGQPSIADLLGLFRMRSIGPGTRVYGVIGWPVGHSLSPHVHNAGFEAVGHDGVYLPLPIPGSRAHVTERDLAQHMDHAPSDLQDAYLAFKATLSELVEHPGLGLAGVSVTLPHKEGLVRLARERGWAIEAAAERIGAANTLRLERDSQGGVIAATVSNTDAPAIASCLSEAMGSLEGKSAVVVGAGGVARAAVYALADAGSRVTIVNRTRDRADALADDLTGLRGSVESADLGTLASLRFDVLVNATPVGMRGGPEERGSPIPEAALRNCTPESVVLDSVYTPPETSLLRIARGAGLRTVDGVAVFVAQAAAQFRSWTGRPAPVRLFERIVRERVHPG